jgi:hypothetical protein
MTDAKLKSYVERIEAAREDYSAAIGQIITDASKAGINPADLVGEQTWRAWLRDKSKPAGHIYFARVVDGDSVKIGFSTAVADRLRSVSAQWGVDLELVGTLPGTMDDEKWFHSMLYWARDYERKGNEFFVYSPLAGFIRLMLANADRWPMTDQVRRDIRDWVLRVHAASQHIERGAPRFSAIRKVFEASAATALKEDAA